MTKRKKLLTAQKILHVAFSFYQKVNLYIFNPETNEHLLNMVRQTPYSNPLPLILKKSTSGNMFPYIETFYYLCPENI